MSDFFSQYAYVCFVCEGTTETDIIQRFHEDHILRFDENKMDFGWMWVRTKQQKEALIDDIASSDRDGRTAILYVHDSRTERWVVNKQSKLFMEYNQIDVIDVITAPEIEILYIVIHPELYQQWNRGTKQKPSLFCKEMLGRKNIKNKGVFVDELFASTSQLVQACRLYT